MSTSALDTCLNYILSSVTSYGHSRSILKPGPYFLRARKPDMVVLEPGYAGIPLNKPPGPSDSGPTEPGLKRMPSGITHRLLGNSPGLAWISRSYGFSASTGVRKNLATSPTLRMSLSSGLGTEWENARVHSASSAIFSLPDTGTWNMRCSKKANNFWSALTCFGR